MKKLWIGITVLIIILLSFFILWSYLSPKDTTKPPKETITLVSEEKLPGDDDWKILTGDIYKISYTYQNVTGYYEVRKIVFQDADALDNAVAGWVMIVSDAINSRTNIKIGDLDGELFFLNTEYTNGNPYSILIKNRNILIYGEGGNKDILLKVFEWFIERY